MSKGIAWWDKVHGGAYLENFTSTNGIDIGSNKDNTIAFDRVLFYAFIFLVKVGFGDPYHRVLEEKGVREEVCDSPPSQLFSYTTNAPHTATHRAYPIHCPFANTPFINQFTLFMSLFSFFVLV